MEICAGKFLNDTSIILVICKWIDTCGTNLLKYMGVTGASGVTAASAGIFMVGIKVWQGRDKKTQE